MSSIPQCDKPEIPPSDVFQHVFGVSLASNLVKGCTGTAVDLQSRLAKKISSKITESGWEVVWGPVVWKSKPMSEYSTYGNAWFVAKNNSIDFGDGTPRPAYVVAIAATSGMWDRIHEDLVINRVVDLDRWASQGAEGLSKSPPVIPNNKWTPTDKPLIALGFGRGLEQIVNNTPPPGAPGSGLTLHQFLQSIQTGPSEPAPKLVFSGHSLGGALAPTLAYLLLKANCLSPFSGTPNSIYVYPTAGPTPGNRSFAENFTTLFPPVKESDSDYKCWNVNIINNLDIVPCAYCDDIQYAPTVLSSIVPMYGNRWLLAVGTVVDGLRAMGKNLYVPIGMSSFNSPIPNLKKKPKRAKAFMDFAYIQHVQAYELKILGYCIPDPDCTKAKEDVWDLYPVMGRILYTQHQFDRAEGMLAEGTTEESESDDE